MKQTTELVLDGLRQRQPALAGCMPDVCAATECIARSLRAGGRILVCGNGGSAADSLHIVGELMKGFCLPRTLSDVQQARLRAACPDFAEHCIAGLQKALPAVSLVSETALLTAFANDQSADLVFAQQVLGQGRAGDVLLAISTSGNSQNVLYAAGVARAMDLRVVGLTGRTGGRLAALCDSCIRVPADQAYLVQEYHLPVYHTICLALEQKFFGE